MPVWSDHDINMAHKVVQNPSSLIWNTWNKDPTKIAVLRAIVSCQVRLGYVGCFSCDMVKALAQKWVCFIHPYSLIGSGENALLNSSQVDFPPKNIFMSLSKYPDFWKLPVSNAPEENHETSWCSDFVTFGA